MSKDKILMLLYDYGMLLVLLALFIVFSFTTIKKQSAQGFGAGQQLAAQATGEKQVILVIKTAGDDRQLKDAFLQNTKGIDVKIVETNVPSEAREQLEALAKSMPANVKVFCSQQTSDWSFVKEIFSGSEINYPVEELKSSFLRSSNLASLPDKTAKTAIIAIGMTMVIITAGIDLSVGSLVAFASVVSTLIIRHPFDNNPGIFFIATAFIAGILSCALFGTISGLLSTFCKIPSFIATLAIMLIARGWAMNLSNNETIKTGLPDITWLGQGTLMGISVPIVLMVILYLIAYIIMHHTTLGRQIYAIGGNMEAARLSGVPVNRVLIIVFTVSGLMAGIAGMVQASELNAGSGKYGDMWELNVIAAVVVGGTSLMGGQGKVLGTLIGCAIIEVINNGMNLMAISSNTQKIVLGLIILFAIILDKVKMMVFDKLKTKKAAVA